MREGDLANFAALRLVERDGFFDGCGDLGVETCGEILLRNSEFPRAALRGQRGAVIGDLRLKGRGIAFVVSGNGAEHDGGIFDRAGKRANLVE